MLWRWGVARGQSSSQFRRSRTCGRTLGGRHRLDSRLLLLVDLRDAVGLAVRPVMMRVGGCELLSNQRRVSIGILVRHRTHDSLPHSDYFLLGLRSWPEGDVL